MGVTVPDNVNVLSAEFKQHYQDLCLEIERLTRITSDLERVRMQTADSQGTPANQTVFFEIGSAFQGPWGEPESYDSCGDGEGELPFLARKYAGSIFTFQEKVPNATGFDVCRIPVPGQPKGDISIGYDLAVVPNLPSRVPEGVQTPPQKLKGGTIVMALYISKNTVVFSSVMPRLGAECPPPEPEDP
jgi:hypothetical protein